MSAMQIDQDKKNKAAINFPCFNCGSHYFISFQRFKIDNYKNLQNVKCQRCKHEWIQIWDMPQQRLYYPQPSLSKRHKKTSRREK